MKISKHIKLINKSKKIRLDIGGGNNPQPNFVNIDYRALDKVDIVHDLEKQPWPLPSECVSVAVSSHVFEHINPAKGGFLNFMNEIWRILQPRGELLISVPYATSPGMFRDPTHVNFISEETFCYWDPHDQFYNGGLYKIYSPLPFQIKINTWHAMGNLEVVLIKRPILKEYNVDKEYLKLLKKHTNLTK